MAVGRDFTYDNLKRAPSYSGSYTVSLSGGSTLSIEDLATIDIGTNFILTYDYVFVDSIASVINTFNYNFVNVRTYG